MTLDLGGHSVTYNNTRTEGLPKRWTVYIEKSGFGVRAMKVPGLKVLNGVIRQGAGNNAAEASSSIGFNPMYLRNGAGNTVEAADLLGRYCDNRGGAPPGPAGGTAEAVAW